MMDAKFIRCSENLQVKSALLGLKGCGDLSIMDVFFLRPTTIHCRPML